MNKQNERCQTTSITRAVWGWACMVAFFLALAYVESERFVEAELADRDVEAVRESSQSVLMLNTAIQRLERMRSLSADVEFQASFFGEKYYGRGEYKEATFGRSFGSVRRPFDRTRFLLDAKLTSANVEDALRKEDVEENFMTIVCDCAAHAWWSYLSIDGTKTLKRINTEELWDTIQKLKDEDRAKLLECGIATLNCGLNSMPGLGGLAGILRRASVAYAFAPDVELIEGEERDLYKIVGKMQLEEFSNLADFVAENAPSEVAIYFDSKDAFPCRIEYYSTVGEGKNAERSLIFSVDYKQNNEPVREEDFNYNQPQSTFEHAEIDYLEELIPDLRL